MQERRWEEREGKEKGGMWIGRRRNGKEEGIVLQERECEGRGKGILGKVEGREWKSIVRQQRERKEMGSVLVEERGGKGGIWKGEEQGMGK